MTHQNKVITKFRLKSMDCVGINCKTVSERLLTILKMKLPKSKG